MSDETEDIVDYKNFSVAKIGDLYYCRKTDYSNVIVPYLSSLGVQDKTTASTSTHVMEEDGYAIAFAESGYYRLDTSTGDGSLASSTFTVESGKSPIFSTSQTYISPSYNSNKSGYELRGYYLKAGDKITVSGKSKGSTGNYYYCITGIQTIYKLPYVYDLSIGLKTWSEKTATSSYTHKEENYKEEFAWFMIFSSSGSISYSKAPTVTSTDDSYLLRPDLKNMFEVAIGNSSSYKSYVSSRFFKLPTRDHTISGKGTSNETNRCPATCVVFSLRY